ncbi:MAG: carboxymuconolactone decarboxylase family protein [Wenzhouxiangella sp.]
MSQNDIPKTFAAFTDRFPSLDQAHRQAAEAIDMAGPLDAKARALVKIGICAGAGLESALKSQVRRGLEAGLSSDEIEHALVLGMNSVGFPKTVAAWQWARKVLSQA